MAKSKLEQNVAKAIAVAKDINTITKLEPPIGAVLDTDAIGKELTAARTEFLETITKEINEVLTIKFDDGYAAQPGDIPKMTEATQAYVKGVLAEDEETMARLFPVKVGKKKAVSKAPVEKGRYGFKVGSMVCFVADCLFEGCTIEDFTQKALAAFPEKDKPRVLSNFHGYRKQMINKNGFSINKDEKTGVYKIKE